MVSSFDGPSGLASQVEEQVILPRLFNLDLPVLKETGNPLLEQGGTSSFHRLLDVASGDGEWAMMVAQAAQEMQIVGIEGDAQLLAEARAQGERRGVKNVTFTAMDPFQRLDFSEDTFDLVNARYLVGLLPAEGWAGALREFVRVTRPNGVIRLTETDLPISNSAAMEQMSSWIGKAYAATKRSFSPTGRMLSMTAVLLRLLQDAGCQQVKQTVWNTNFSAGMPAHGEVTEDLARTYRLVQPFLVSVKVAGEEEIEEVYQRMLVDMRSERFTASAISLTVWGSI
jgi:ubiquinone/menaquinone biosynthesis C-methylase UbiE